MSVTAVPLRPIKKGSVGRLWFGVAVVAAASALLTWNGLRPFGHSDIADKDGKLHRISYQIIEPGTGEKPGRDDFAQVSYKGVLPNGTKFDESSQPVVLDLGGQTPGATMIPGFSGAVMELRKNGRLRVQIPPELAYGSEARGETIPANSTLIFEITLHDFKSRAEVMEMQRQMQMQQMLQQGMQPGGAPGGAPGQPAPLPEGATPQ